MEGFVAYVRLVRKRGPEPFWTPVAPVHRIFSYFFSYAYAAMRLTPLAVTLVGLAMALAGAALLVAFAGGGWPFWLGLGLVNLGVIHDACDGEVARYRLQKGLQSTATYRVGMFADFWAFAILVQAVLPAALGLLAWRRGGPAGLAVAGAGAGFLLLASYVAGFARHAYWPSGGARVVEQSFSFAAGGPRWLQALRKLYFHAFETAMFTTHASILLAAWTAVGGLPWWAVAYVGGVAGVLCAAFGLATAMTLRTFDRRGPA